jgi:hypothetical protein
MREMVDPRLVVPPDAELALRHARTDRYATQPSEGDSPSDRLLRREQLLHVLEVSRRRRRRRAAPRLV